MKRRIAAMALSVILTGSMITSTIWAGEEVFQSIMTDDDSEAYEEDYDISYEIYDDADCEEFTEESADEDENEADVVDEIKEDETEEVVLESEISEEIEDSGDDFEDDDWITDEAELLEAINELPKEGQCGDDLQWRLDEYEDEDHQICGLLTVYGTGNMWNYSAEKRPEWDGLSFDHVYIQDGVASVGDYAFCNDNNILLAAVEDSVQIIGSHAFEGCTNLSSAAWGDGLKVIGDSAFENCNLSVEPAILASVESIGSRAFAGNAELSSIKIAGLETTIGVDAFAGCASDFTIFCNAGSKAEQYAIEHGIKYSTSKRSIAVCDVVLSETSFVYDGKAKKPTVTVEYEGTTLVENQDYTLEYNNYVNAGSAGVWIFGIGMYDGVEFQGYSIKKANTVITAADKTLRVNVKENQFFNINAKVNSGAKLSYQSNNSNVVVNSAGKVGIKKTFVGTAEITISAAATANYNAAKKTIKVVVAKWNNTITASNKALYGNYAKVQYYNINATVKGGAKLYYQSNNKYITVDSKGKVTIRKNYTGSAIITIKSAATKYYYGATKQIKIAVVRRNNVINVSNLTLKATNAGAKTVPLNAKTYGGARLTYKSNNTNITVDAYGRVTVKRSYSGKAIITITSSQTNVFKETTKEVTVVVNKVNNIINASDKTVYVNTGAATFVTIGAKAGGGAVLTYQSNNPYIAVNDKGIVTVAKGYSGSALITITSSATSVYKATVKRITVSSIKRNNVISASGRTLDGNEYSSQSFDLNARVNGGARLSYNSSNGHVYVNSLGHVIVSKGFTGSATITIRSSATAEYNAASKNVVITVRKIPQTLTFRPSNWSWSAASLKYQAQKFEIVPLMHKGTVSLKSKTPAYIMLYKENGHHMVTVKKGTPKGTYIVEVTASEYSVYSSVTKQLKITVF